MIAETIRLVFVSICLLFSLLVIIPAPTNFFWKAAIVLTEQGYYIAIFIILLFLFPWWNTFIGKLSFGFGLLTVCLLLFPVFRSMAIGNSLVGALERSFGKTTLADGEPFKFSTLLFGFKSEKAPPESLKFKGTGNQALCLDLYRAAESKWPAPCIVVVHGGAWSGGDSSEIPFLNRYFASKGYTVASVNYRLAPEHPFPAAVEDVKSAIHYLKRNAKNLGIDPAQLFLLGRSAGGQIALLTAYTAKELAINGVVAFYTPADMVWAYSIPGNPLILDSRKVLEDYLGGSYSEVQDKFHQSSPLEFVDSASPPTLLIHGVRDEMVAYQHSLKLEQKLEKNGVENYLLSLPWATHGFDYFPIGPGGQLSTYAIEFFLNQQTQKLALSGVQHPSSSICISQ
jgi:acetyl esterase/lipase